MHLEPDGDGRLETDENLVISSVKTGVRLIKRIRKRVTALSAHAEPYQLLSLGTRSHLPGRQIVSLC